jgi:hypothetical protein
MSYVSGHDTVLMMVMQFFRLWRRQGVIGASSWAIGGMSVPHVVAEVATRKARGGRLVGVLTGRYDPQRGLRVPAA